MRVAGEIREVTSTAAQHTTNWATLDATDIPTRGMARREGSHIDRARTAVMSAIAFSVREGIGK